MSFLLRLVDKFKKLFSSNEIPKVEEYHTLKKNYKKPEQQIPKIKIEYSSEPTYRSRPKREQPERMKYTRAQKLTKDYVVFDFETTGLSQFDSKIIQIGAVKYKNHTIIDRYETYINPQTEISSRITQINGITNDHVKDAPLIQDALPELLDFIADYHLVAHNASFDMKFLLYNMNTHDLPYKRFRVFDTLSLARRHISTKNHKLITLKKHFKLDQYDSHDALDDCLVTGEVYKYCYEQVVNPPMLTFKEPEHYEAFPLYEIGMRLYKNKQLEDAEKYLLASIDKGNNAPAVFERLAIIYRKQKRYQDEINISEFGKKVVGKSQGTYRNHMFDTRIERAKELL